MDMETEIKMIHEEILEIKKILKYLMDENYELSSETKLGLKKARETPHSKYYDLNDL